jgi:NTF2 fold immunity protein
VRQTILCFALLCVLAVPQDLLASPRLNQWTAINAGLAALKVKYPNEYQDLILKYRPFVAKFEDGVWHVYGKTPIPGMLGGGAPVIEIRDRDERVLKIYFAK